MKRQNLLLALAVLLLAIIPLCMVKPTGPDAEVFAGADGEAEALIGVIHPEYEPWYAPLWEPPSGEIESLLFALQAALGTGVLCYTIGYFRGKRKVNSAA